MKFSVKVIQRLMKSMVQQAAGVPTVPGSDGLIKDEEEAMYYAEKVRIPHPL